MSLPFPAAIKRVACFSMFAQLATASMFAAITLVDQTGAQLTGEVIRVGASDAVLDMNGQRRTIKLSSLSDASRDELLSHAKAQGVHAPFPPLRVQVLVGTQQRRMAGGTSYRKQMEIEPRFTVEAVNRLEPLPEAEAIMIIVTMDTRAKYTARQEVYKVHGAQTLKLPATTTGERRQFTFEPSSVTYDSYRDNSNVGGEVYKYYVFGIRDSATNAIVEFQTNHQQLATLCKRDPTKRVEFLALKTGAKFPSDIR